MASTRSFWLAIACCAALGCGDENDPVAPDGTYAARLESSDAWLAVVVEGADAAAFVCGGAQSLTTHTRWMGAPNSGTVLRFSEAGWSLDLAIGASGASGDLFDPGGLRSSFSATRLETVGGVSGLFSGTSDGCRAGVIAFSSAEVQGALCEAGADFVAQVTPVQPVLLAPSGLAVEAETPAGVAQFFVQPLDPAEVAVGP